MSRTALLMIGLSLACGLAPARASDPALAWLPELMDGSYRRLAPYLQLPSQPGTPEWDTAVSASVAVVLAMRPRDCGDARFGADLCGLRSIHSPYPSMAPTLREREFLIAAPYAPDQAIERGDIVAFTSRDGSGRLVEFTLRVIGLPGETVELREGIVHIDGVPMAQTPTGQQLNDDTVRRQAQIVTETTPEGRSYPIIPLPGRLLNSAGPYQVPEGALFVLGDNRAIAPTSRLPHFNGRLFVPIDAIIGRVAVVYMSADPARIGVRVAPR